MARTGRGATDNQRTAIGIVFTVLLTLNTSLAGLAASNQVVVPQFVYFALAIAAVVIYAVKDQLGVRTSTEAKVAKKVNPNLEQHRESPAADNIGSSSSSGNTTIS